MGPKTRSKTSKSKKQPEKIVEHVYEKEEDEEYLMDDVDEESKLKSKQ